MSFSFSRNCCLMATWSWLIKLRFAMRTTLIWFSDWFEIWMIDACISYSSEKAFRQCRNTSCYFMFYISWGIISVSLCWCWISSLNRFLYQGVLLWILDVLDFLFKFFYSKFETVGLILRILQSLFKKSLPFSKS